MIKVDHSRFESWFNESNSNVFVIYKLGDNKSLALEHYKQYVKMYKPTELNMFL